MATKDVEDAIRHVRRVIADSWNLASGNETRTRYMLIDPIIASLGWDTTDPIECIVEYERGQQSRVDYALFDGNAELVVLIEAKSVGNLPFVPRDERHRDYWRGSYKSLPEYLMASTRPDRRYEVQLRDYARGFNRGIGVLTDGESWNLYDLEKTGRIDRKRFAYVDVDEGNLRDAARTLHQWLRKERWW